jgi:2-polyprenyl-6-methoxyphenol hydroxylase-like FAD-dependent oxidoreductase
MGSPRPSDERVEPCDVLIVGAGPTGLALAAALRAFGVSLRLVDAAADRVHESRALAMQPRTLEVLRPVAAVAESLIERGNRAARLRLSAGGRTAHTPLFDIGVEDTAFPFLLFVSQAETEAVLIEHLAAQAVEVERGVTFETFRHDGEAGLLCSLRRTDGSREVARARYVVGCDGARSVVREQAGIPFLGGRYPQTFLLADLAADGLEAGTVNTYLGPDGPVFFFPLGRPAPWRLITIRPRTGDETGAQQVTVSELQQASDQATGGAVRVRDPVWTSVFRVHHRAAARYRAGPVFVAGDAAHVHSPAGAQGMNTGIQDAVNLGWKLGLVCRGGAPEALLDSYDVERRPVGEFVLRFTDRAFTVVTSANPLIRAVRSQVVPRVLPWALRFRAGRRLAFRTVSQLGIRYRHSPAVETSPSAGRGPRPGDRLPDARVFAGGAEMWLHEALTAPTFHLLLCGPAERWDGAAVESLRQRSEPYLTVHRLAPGSSAARAGDAALRDPSGSALARLGVRGSACLVVRPDGHIGHRVDEAELSGADNYLRRWLPEHRSGADVQEQR